MLTPKQQKFVAEYLIDLNATQAAIRAGYSEKTARAIANKLLTKADIQAAIQAAQADLQKRTGITQERVLNELAKIGFADIRKAVKWSPTLGTQVVGDEVTNTNGVLLTDSEQLDDDTAAAISEVSQGKEGIKIKFHDKQAALVSIGRHLGMFNDKLNLGGQPGNPVQVTKIELVGFSDDEDTSSPS